jgi:hypothetical protein
MVRSMVSAASTVKKLSRLIRQNTPSPNPKTDFWKAPHPKGI